MLPSHTLTIPRTKPSVQHLSITTPITPAVDLPEMCAYCDQSDDECECEHLYFRLQSEQEGMG